MKRTLGFGLAQVIVVIGLSVGAVSAAENVWIAQEGHGHGVHGGAHAMFFGDDDADKFDVADLADGERRVFGEGSKQIVAERNGDEVTLTRVGDGDEQALSITCRLSSDSCNVLTFDGDDDGERVMIMVQKSRTCEDGEGDCDTHIVSRDVLPDGATQITIRQSVHCDDGGDCLELHDVFEHAGKPGQAVVHVEALGHHGEGNVFVLGQDGTGDVLMVGGDVLLRCPEGDARLTVSKEEAEDVFLCPKHSVAMEKVDRGHPRRLRVETRAHETD